MSVHPERVAGGHSASCENRNPDLDAAQREWLFAETQSINDVVRNRIREARKKKGLTLAQLAAVMTDLEVPLDKSAMSKIENGKQKVKVEELFAFAYVFDVSLAQLVSPLDGELDVRVGGGALPRRKVPLWLALGDTKQAALFTVVMDLARQIQTMVQVIEEESDPEACQEHRRKLARLLKEQRNLSMIPPGIMKRKALRERMSA